MGFNSGFKGLISVMKFQDRLLEDKRSPVGMAKDLSHLHSCDTDACVFQAGNIFCGQIT